MTQLTYNEAFDPYHAAFRFMRLRLGCKLAERTHIDMFRILDFYLLFPFRIQKMSFLSSDRKWRSVSKSYEKLSPYGELPEDVSIFSKMEPFQRAAATSLVQAGVLSAEAWQNNQIEFLSTKFPSELEARCVELNEGMSDIIDILCSIRERYPLLGHNGLKARTGLLEFRYDSL